MKRLFTLAVAITVLCAFAGCAQKQVVTMATDWRTGTDYTPYRTIPAAVQCDDCKFGSEQ